MGFRKIIILIGMAWFTVLFMTLVINKELYVDFHLYEKSKKKNQKAFQRSVYNCTKIEHMNTYLSFLSFFIFAFLVVHKIRCLYNNTLSNTRGRC